MAKGFNKGQQMGGGGMMQQLQRLQKQMEDAQAKLAEETVTATAGSAAIGTSVKFYTPGCTPALPGGQARLHRPWVLRTATRHLRSFGRNVRAGLRPGA